MRQDQDTSWWLMFDHILGFEDDDDEDEDEEDPSEEEDEDEEENDSEDEEEGKPKKKGKPKTYTQEEFEAETRKLRSALRKERAARREAEKKAPKSKKPKGRQSPAQEDEDDADTEQLKQQAARLAQRLRTQEIEKVVSRAARKMGFVDEEDAVRLIDEGELDIEQDDEDPTRVRIDADSIKDALEKLKEEKPHLIRQPDDEEDEEDEDEGEKPRVSKFNKKKGSRQQLTDEELRKRYPGLRR